MASESLEAELADEVAAFIAASEADSADTQERLISLGQRLEWLAYEALRQHEGWSRYWWVDGLDCESALVAAPSTVAIRGVLIWVDGDNWWIDPVRLVLRLASTLPQIDSYEIAFGDAVTGVGQIPYGDHPPQEWGAVTSWLITVRGRGYPGLHQTGTDGES